MIKCSIPSAVVFVLLSLIYGSAFAIVEQGMKYFSPCGVIFYRMLFGFIVATAVCGIKCLITKGYWQIVKAHFTSGIPYILWTALGGLLFHGAPHCIISFAQLWVSSASVQVAQPLATGFGALLSHFVLPDEPFNMQKAIVLILSLAGVALSSIPSFMGNGGGSGTVGQIALGYVLLIIGVAFFGFAAVIMKWKTPNSDAAASAVIQTAASVIVTFIVELIYDGPANLVKSSSGGPAIKWLWPFLVGFLGTGLAATGYNYLVACWGAAGANLIPFGQILVGVLVGVIFLKEWAKYTVWQIVVSIIGIILLVISIILGFWDKKPAPRPEDGEEPGDLEDIEMDKDKQPQFIVGKEGNLEVVPGTEAKNEEQPVISEL